MKNLFVLLFLLGNFFCANAQAPSNQLKTRQLTVVDNGNISILKTTLGRRVEVYSDILDVDSSIQAATTQWTKKQLYAQSQGLFKRYAVPFGLSNGKLSQDSVNFNWGGTTLQLGSGGAGSNSLMLNTRAEIQGSTGGVIINIGSGYPGGGTYDGSKSFQFMNRGNNYLTMSTLGSVHTSRFFTNVEVNGLIKITGGTPGIDKVLTSDAAGNATWQNNSISLASPTFTGFPAAPTQPTGINNTTLATTAFVQNSLAAQVKDTSFITAASQNVLQVTTTAGKDSLGFKKQGVNRFIAAGADSNILARVIAITDLPSNVVLVNNTQLANTGNTTENTVYTGVIPANSIGVNGSFHINTLLTATNNANTKTFRLKINGTTINTSSLTSVGSMSTYTIIRNRNNAAIQVSGNAGSASNAGFNTSTTGGIATYAFNTAASLTFTITVQCSVGTDTGSVEAFEIIRNY